MRIHHLSFIVMEMASQAAVRVERRGKVAVIRLDNPPVNAIGDEVLSGLDAVLDALEPDPGVAVVIVTGAGYRAFSAGSDIKEFPSYLERGALVSEKLARENRVFSRLAEFRTPTIAAIEGMALGGGLELAVCCDLIVCSSSARLALPEIGIGGFPGSGGVARVPGRIGFSRAARMMFLGEAVDPVQAQGWGLVDQICEPGEALATAFSLAEKLTGAPAVALAACKAALVAGRRHQDAAAIAGSLRCSERIEASVDFREGVSAFIAKRPPRFTGDCGQAVTQFSGQ